MPRMRPYWIMIEQQPKPTVLHLGIGVTAGSEEEARAIFSEAFGDFSIASVAPISNMNDLDHGHVIPNMGNWFQRGIWFPLGYENSN